MRQFQILLLMLVGVVVCASFAWGQQANATGEMKRLQVRGRAVCLDAAGQRTARCDEPDQPFGFAAADGKLWRFLAADPLPQMFKDQRVRERELQLTARPVGNGQLELIKIQSIQNGQRYDLYYYCGVCDVTTYEPGPCPCCREELEFKETPDTSN